MLLCSQHFSKSAFQARFHAKVHSIQSLNHGLNQATQHSLAQQVLVRQCALQAATAEAPVEAVAGDEDEIFVQEKLRNIAIVAHVDHGKTTLVDGMLKQGAILGKDLADVERIMDSNDLEKERGITILSKNTSINYKDTKINVIDTPGHADFGGEVERVLNMCDGVLLLVDSVDGPMPQTRFVVQKALKLNKKIVLVINKIDKPNARPDFVVDKTFDLLCELDAEDWQLDFPTIYASALEGVAGNEPDQLADNLEPLLEAILDHIPAPRVYLNRPLQLQVSNIDYDDYKGRIAIGRVLSGKVQVRKDVSVCSDKTDVCRPGHISYLFTYSQFQKVEVEEVKAGDICAINGLDDVMIGETICARDRIIPLPSIALEEPTVSMTFYVNPSPLAGTDSQKNTLPALQERLFRELDRNVTMKIENDPDSEGFIVKGRGALHIGILIENMRREGYEFAVGAPKVLCKEGEDGEALEPYERVQIDVPPEYEGTVLQKLQLRKGEWMDQEEIMGQKRITYKMPTQTMLGLRTELVNACKGNIVFTSNFMEYGPAVGEVKRRHFAPCLNIGEGKATAYSLENGMARASFIIEPGEVVFNGQLIGESKTLDEVQLNITKEKKLTNVRRAYKEVKTQLHTARKLALEEMLEYIEADELVEVTPKNLRIFYKPGWEKRKREARMAKKQALAEKKQQQQ